MKTYKIVIEVELSDDAPVPNWIIPSVDGQLEENESIGYYSVEQIGSQEQVAGE